MTGSPASLASSFRVSHSCCPLGWRSSTCGSGLPAARKWIAGAAGRPPQLGLVVRVGRVVVLHDEGVVQVVRGAAVPDRRPVHPGQVGPVRDRQRAGVRRPEQEPVAQRGVVVSPGQAGRDGLRVDAHLLELGVAGPAALGAVRRPAAGHRVVREGQPIGVRGLPGRDRPDGQLGPLVQLGPEDPGGEHEVQLERRVPEQLAAPLVATGQPVRTGEAVDRGQGPLFQGGVVDPGQLRVVVLDGEQHRVAQHRREPEVRRPGRRRSPDPTAARPTGCAGAAPGGRCRRPGRPAALDQGSPLGTATDRAAIAGIGTASAPPSARSWRRDN